MKVASRTSTSFKSKLSSVQQRPARMRRDKEASSSRAITITAMSTRSTMAVVRMSRTDKTPAQASNSTSMTTIMVSHTVMNTGMKPTITDMAMSSTRAMIMVTRHMVSAIN